ncbi:MAG TPA: type I restriction endonuclease subunit R [Nitrospirae bacterium]|nr:type I restriction endonuclease subunit R [Nitrospirota bacterium]
MNSQDWNELHLSEDPAVELLQSIGYAFIPSDELDKERASRKEVFLVRRLGNAIRKLNPWISEENLKKAVREIANVQAVSLMEANKKVHTALVHTISLEQDLGQGKKGQSVHFIDFENPENNEFIVTRQFRIQGSKKLICPDIVVFVNGIPLVIIECKSPTIQNPIEDAITQLLRYQEIGEKFKGQGAPHLFEPAQILIATCGQVSMFATMGTIHRHYAEWKVPFPMTLDELAGTQPITAKGMYGLGLIHKGRKTRKGGETPLQSKGGATPPLQRIPTPQDVLLYGMLYPDNLLDIVRNFTVFEVVGGTTVKKVARYQQFIAVNRAIERILSAKSPARRGGIIWHTQGSGKSLTMLWLTVKLRRIAGLENPTIVIVTDRVDLDKQISGTFERCGFPNPERAKSVTDLRKLLRSGQGKTIMTTIQKFQEATGKLHPVLTEEKNLFVMVDEAHRTQYKSLAANLRRAMPNACFLGFTGTPIDKKDRSTIQTFGPYIHTYTIEQSVKDRATVPIYYESRLPNLRVEGETLDTIFERVFKDYTDNEREEIKRKYATIEAIAGAPRRIERICLDIIEHFEKYIYPNGFKAQVVAVNRDTAVTYKATLDRLGAPESVLIMSATHNDPERLARYHLSREKQQELIERFKDRNDSLAILIVCDMLITGFDAPVEQVMYLDSPFKEHTLLQAIARVNRTAEGKDYGLVVDYWGISRCLQDALGIFHPEDIEGVMRPKSDELPRLESRHRAAMRFFDRVDRGDMEACLKVLEPEDVRAEFDISFRRFTQSMDMLLPDPSALPYIKDLKWLGKVRNAARARYRDPSLDLSGCREKVRKIIEEHIQVPGIDRLLEPVSIFSERFDEEVARLSSTEAQASEMEHAIRHEISVRFEEDPVFYQSLKERVEKIIEEKRQERIDAARQLKLLQTIKDEMINVHKVAETMGISETELAFYNLLSNVVVGAGSPRPFSPPASLKVAEEQAPYGEKKEPKKELAGLILESLEKLSVIDWIHKEDVQRQMRRQIKRHLRAAGYKLDEIEPLTTELMELARVRLGR